MRLSELLKMIGRKLRSRRVGPGERSIDGRERVAEDVRLPIVPTQQDRPRH